MILQRYFALTHKLIALAWLSSDAPDVIRLIFSPCFQLGCRQIGSRPVAKSPNGIPHLLPGGTPWRSWAGQASSCCCFRVYFRRQQCSPGALVGRNQQSESPTGAASCAVPPTSRPGGRAPGKSGPSVGLPGQRANAKLNQASRPVFPAELGTAA